ncbi:GH3 auxin-responsive promoter family protein [Arenibacter sp. GZD96]|uniref:GH3 auxin-responsive promoter family protein n=1 Tax=Aurantibrevibacter litoralis TaxID=3106030 RepID=UPI002AFFCCBD|nr:GH3 auxin-responsive promoter family protein [Arenibacter sp. GZD-96]MEA1786457.1 GH3 auxin-responsive promoter family protein [Arenibacter sp. GZD-96]
MSLKAFAAKYFARYVALKTKNWANTPIKTQNRVFRELITSAVNTQFGKDHEFKNIQSHADFVAKVPVRDYEGLKPYVDQVVAGKEGILWPGKPIYFAKTSGTTSGVKFIPITKASIGHHIDAARDAILSYIHETGNAAFVDGKMIFLQGSPELKEKNGIKLGRLSGISAHYVPTYLQRNRLPTWDTNCIEDWEIKVNQIVTETLSEDMTVIAGIPSWVQMYFEKVHTRSGKKVTEVFPNLQLFIYGGVNYEPYRAKFEDLLGKPVDSIELFPASEGFFAYQNSQKDKSLLLLLNSGIFYEFIKADMFFEPNPERLTLENVQIGINYVMIISTNAGLWGYNIGDTVQFTCTKPYKIIVTGRIKHFLSAFGEHVIAKEIEEAMRVALSETDAQINEFSVAPQITPANKELPYHEWLVEFEKRPTDMEKFATILDNQLQKQNSYYFDLIQGGILQRLKITCVAVGGFRNYMESIGKLGGQNKVQRLANDRKLADALSVYSID